MRWTIAAAVVVGVSGLVAGAAAHGPHRADDAPFDGPRHRPLGPGGFAGGPGPGHEGPGFGPGGGPGFGHGRHHGGDRMREMHTRAIERFDTDGDGALSETERATAHGAFAEEHPEAAARAEKMRARFMARWDTDGDGAMSDAEREAFRGHARAERERFHADMLRRFDADGDGALSDAERREARETHHAKMRERHEAILAEFDADKDGRLSREEREDARPMLETRFLSQRNMGALDANHDRAIDKAEIARGVELIRDGNPWGDFNGDGAVNEADAAALLERAARGAPERGA